MQGSNTPVEDQEKQGERSAASAEGANLDHWTLTDEHVLKSGREYGATTEPSDSEKWCLTVTDFGSGDIECTASYCADGWGSRVRSKRKAIKKAEKERKQNKEDIERSLRRTRKSIRHRIMMMNSDKMITCTTAEPIVVLADWEKMTTEFFRLCRAKFKNFKYVAVFERHDSEQTSQRKRHSLHMHFATVGFIDYNAIRTIWRNVVVKHRGTDFEAANINGSLSHRGNKALGRIRRSQMARYMCKYAAKDVEYGDPCRRRYWSSKNIEAPKKIRLFFAVAIGPANFFRRVIEDITDVQIKFCYAPPRDSGSHVPVLYYSSG